MSENQEVANSTNASPFINRHHRLKTLRKVKQLFRQIEREEDQMRIDGGAKNKTILAFYDEGRHLPDAELLTLFVNSRNVLKLIK